MTLQLYWPIQKIDGDARLVYGYASTEATDSQGETVKREALEAALPAYMRFANIREMHLPSAVGVAQEATIDEKGLWLKAKIVDDDAWRKVREGVYKGFSIGGAVTGRDGANPQIVTGVDLTEISLVDRPANPEAVLSLWKRGGADGFADPGFQPDGKPRYPLDTEAEIRAAWGYIHHAANRAGYSDGERRHIEARIVAAWKAKIDPDGPPAAQGDNKVALARLADTLAKGGDGGDLVQSIHDQAVALGARCCADDDAAKLAGAAMAKLMARNDALAERIAAALPLLTEVKALVEKVAAQPAVVPPARLVAVEKGADVARELERIAEQPPALTALELIRRAVREPLPFGARLER